MISQLQEEEEEEVPAAYYTVLGNTAGIDGRSARQKTLYHVSTHPVSPAVEVRGDVGPVCIHVRSRCNQDGRAPAPPRATTVCTHRPLLSLQPH